MGADKMRGMREGDWGFYISRLVCYFGNEIFKVILIFAQFCP